MKTSDLPRDIFGITMYATQKARLHEFSKFVSALSRIGEFDSQVSFWKLRLYVEFGVLSPQSASYFFAGRASSFQVAMLESCVSLIKDWKQSEVIKFLRLWQKQNVSAPESTFLFPLAELGSKESFEGEKERYKDFKYQDLQLL